jgi:hypothetical protein
VIRTIATLLACAIGLFALGFALAALLSDAPRERGNLNGRREPVRSWPTSELGRLPAQTPLACRELRLSPLSELAIGEARESSLCLASIASDVPGLYPGERRANRWRGSVSAEHAKSTARAFRCTESPDVASVAFGQLARAWIRHFSAVQLNPVEHQAKHLEDARSNRATATWAPLPLPLGSAAPSTLDDWRERRWV